MGGEEGVRGGWGVRRVEGERWMRGEEDGGEEGVRRMAGEEDGGEEYHSVRW